MRRWICVCALLGACGGGGGEGDAALDAPAVVDAAGPRDWPAAEVPAVTEPEPGIRREVLTLEGHPAPPNPSTGDATPDALDRVQVVRYSGMDEPDVRAVVVAMPGIFGGQGASTRWRATW